MTIDQIITACINGNSKAEYQLYKLLYTKYMGMCLRYRRDKDAATISFNNAFVKILGNLKSIKDVQVFDGWVKRIIINQMITEINKQKKERERTESLDEDLNYSIATVHNNGSEKLNADYLRGLLQKLPATTGHVFNLFAVDGFSHKEIASMMEISVGTSKWHVSEARKRLQTALKSPENKKLVKVAR